MWIVVKFAQDLIHRVRPYNGDMHHYTDSVYGEGRVIAIFHNKIQAQAYTSQLNGGHDR